MVFSPSCADIKFPKLLKGDPVTMEENGRSSRWMVLINADDQYGLFPAELPAPAGWTLAGYAGTEAGCIAYVDEHWTDMRPRSIRPAFVAENASS